MPKTPSIPGEFRAAQFLARARLYRAQATLLSDKVNIEPNWPKFFVITHAIELAINSYLIFEKSLARRRVGHGGKIPDHDLLALYNAAVHRGLKSNPLVLKELPFLSELHKVHYARYPQIESRPVPAYISEYDDMLDQLLTDIGNALGPVLGQMRGP
jgi:hypothetical protein